MTSYSYLTRNKNHTRMLSTLGLYPHATAVVQQKSQKHLDFTCNKTWGCPQHCRLEAFKH